jgi:hypothetical protein
VKAIEGRRDGVAAGGQVQGPEEPVRIGDRDVPVIRLVVTSVCATAVVATENANTAMKTESAQA